MTGRPLNEVLEAVTRAAGHGVEQTKNTVATKGKSQNPWTKSYRTS